jgi:NADPH2:quinone reductase
VALDGKSTVLVHAAAGGVGLLLVQMLKMLGVRVFGTVSNEAKAKLAREAGADELILYTQQNFAEAVKSLTSGRGVDAVFDSVGRDTFDGSLSVLRPRGMLVLYGQSSGTVPPVDPARLHRGGALFLTRPALHFYAATREELTMRAREVFGWIAEKKLNIRIDREYPLTEAKQAHEDLSARKTTGKLLLIP